MQNFNVWEQNTIYQTNKNTTVSSPKQTIQTCVKTSNDENDASARPTNQSSASCVPSAALTSVHSFSKYRVHKCSNS